jgi:hypothetical protein
MRSPKLLLNKLLQALVEEWGKEEVLAAVARTSAISTGAKFVSAHHGAQRINTSSVRLNAAQQVEQTTAVGNQRELLLTIADRFDRKEFLPSVADVREFIMMTGKQPGSVKDRKDAFRVILSLLLDLPQDRLHQVLRTALTSGPSQLGPISDAISGAAERLTRHGKIENPDEIPFKAAGMNTHGKEAPKAVFKDHSTLSLISDRSTKKA